MVRTCHYFPTRKGVEIGRGVASWFFPKSFSGYGTRFLPDYWHCAWKKRRENIRRARSTQGISLLESMDLFLASALVR